VARRELSSMLLGGLAFEKHSYIIHYVMQRKIYLRCCFAVSHSFEMTLAPSHVVGVKNRYAYFLTYKNHSFTHKNLASTKKIIDN